MAIDWAATGTWMQAWAGFTQAGAVAFVGWKGANVFKTWRRQKIEERKMDAAERILTLTYRLRRAFTVIRSPMMWAGALDAAEKRLREAGVTLDSLPELKRKNMIYHQAMLDRINSFEAEWAEIGAVTPIAAALFGKVVEEQLELLWRQRGAVAVASESYADDRGQDNEFTAQLRADMWEGMGKHNGAGDRITEIIDGVVTKVEAALLPVLREDAEPRPT